ncbi:hypothetical protein HFM87_17880 [Blautia producta]|nr:hypothetical protein [Blautia producta]NSG17712.1 hypothetical protein [Blautia producta]NSJ77889.1 hypothetical protein [Blautia producta]
MKKKIVAIMLASMMAFSVVGCGNDNGKKVESQKEISAEEKSEKEQAEEQATAGKEISAETNESTTGEVVEQDGLRKEPVATNKELNLEGETGPFKYVIEGVQVSKLTATTDEMAEMLGIEKDKEVALVAINASAENTTADTLTFYLGQATLTTSTKEQVESDIILSDYIDGEFLGNVKHSGNLIYILKQSKAEDITGLTLHIDAPQNENFENIGDEVKIDISLK